MILPLQYAIRAGWRINASCPQDRADQRRACRTGEAGARQAVEREAYPAQLPQQPLLPFDTTGWLRTATPFSLEDDLKLVEATGRSQHPDKRGKMPEQAPRLLQRLRLDAEQFVECSA
ncbi:MAG: hypothetical protein ACUVT2_11720 [Thiobacillaceae bacterium]